MFPLSLRHFTLLLFACPKAAESISKIAAVLSTPQIEEYYIPLLKRLSQGEWFTSRTSSAALYSPVYSKVSPIIQDELRKAFATLGADDTPMVRRAAARWLGVRFGFLMPPPPPHVYLASGQKPPQATSTRRWPTNLSQTSVRRSGFRTPVDGRGSDHHRSATYPTRSQGTAPEANKT